MQSDAGDRGHHPHDVRQERDDCLMHPLKRHVLQSAEQDQNGRAKTQRHHEEADEGHDNRIGKNSKPGHLIEIVGDKGKGCHRDGKGYQHVELSPIFEFRHDGLRNVIFPGVPFVPLKHEDNGEDGHI